MIHEYYRRQEKETLRRNHKIQEGCLTASGSPFPFDIRPDAFQQEILDKLEAERTLHGKVAKSSPTRSSHGKRKGMVEKVMA
jgi:hypothetical protein